MISRRIVFEKVMIFTVVCDCYWCLSYCGTGKHSIHGVSVVHTVAFTWILLPTDGYVVVTKKCTHVICKCFVILRWVISYCICCIYVLRICGSKSSPITGLDRPWEFQEFQAPKFHDNRHMKVLRLSALRTGRPYPPGNIPGTLLCPVAISSVDIVTDYGLDGPGSIPGGDEIFRPSRPTLGPTQPPVKWLPVLSRR
jgi:hypothetical protein